MSAGSKRPYQLLAQRYDELFLRFGDSFAAARNKLAGPLLAQAEAVCDLACGTGSAAVQFAGKGIRTYGVDLSPEMCRLARAKARYHGVPVRVIQADMRNFRLPEPVDLVTCEYDAVNHIPRKADLARVAKAVSRALKPGGHFYFDVNNRKGFARYWTGNVWIEQPDFVLLMLLDNDAARDRAWAELEWFLRDGTRWRRRSERVDEVCWSGSEMREALAAAGFDRVRAADAKPFFPRDERIRPGCRTFYLARKAGRGS